MAAAVIAADLFSGAGGFSTALSQACDEAGAKLRLTAVNHWSVAVETHAKNHPHAAHHCVAVESLEPSNAIPGGKLDLLIASPSCTHHSRALGGKPRDDQSRASGWHILHWAEALRPRVILVENVREWLDWGPLTKKGEPIKSKKGQTFAAWVEALRVMGYAVQWRVLNAADHGDPTTRERLFVVATLGRTRFEWPEPTHVPQDGDLFGRPKWRAAREVIDWTLKGTSIAGRKRPLAANTLRRIAAGLARFGGEAFLAHLTHRGGERVHGAGNPVPTVTGANRGEMAVIEPFVTQFKGTAPSQLRGTAQSVADPLNTITGGGGSFGLCEPFLVPTNYGEREGQAPRTHATAAPMPTVVGSATHALVEPFVLGQQSGAVARSVNEPAPTIAAKGAISLIEPLLVAYYGNGGPRPTGEPLDTVTTRDRFGLVEGSTLEILFRMLQPHELAAAMSFPRDYKFAGNREAVVKQIGNAVAVCTARALCAQALRAIGRAA